MNFVVTGEISIYNPAAIAQTFTVTDALDDLTAVTVDCPALDGRSPANGDCTYEAFPADATATLNTATVTATGNPTRATADAIDWKENLTGYDCGMLTDPRFNYEETISGDTSVDFDETFTCPTDPSVYTNGCTPTRSPTAPTSTATSTSPPRPRWGSPATCRRWWRPRPPPAT